MVVSLQRIGLYLRLSFLLTFFLAISLPLRLVCAEPILTTAVNPTEGTTDDTFTFAVTVDGLENSRPPLLIGGDDFKLSLIGPSSSVTIINGKVSAKITYNYQLIPKRTGDLMTPSVELDLGTQKLSSPPKQVVVMTHQLYELKDRTLTTEC